MTVLIVIGLVVIVVAKRLRGEPLASKDTLLWPLVMVALGVRDQLAHALGTVDVLFLVAAGLAGLAAGALRGGTIALFQRDGTTWQRYTKWTLLVWAGSAVVSGGITLLGKAMGAAAHSTSLSIGLSLLGEAAVLAVRTGQAAELLRRPTAPRDEPSPPQSWGQNRH